MDLFSKNIKYYIESNNDQITGIYWNELTRQYHGLCLDNERQNHVILDNWWVEHNFEINFLKVVRDKAITDKIKFVKLPIGLSKPQVLIEDMKNNPLTKYQQNGKDTCVFASMSSALDYMEFTTLAYIVNKFEKEYIRFKLKHNYEKIMGTLNYELVKTGDKKFNKTYEKIRIRNIKDFNILHEASLHVDDLYHVVIKGEDGSQNHCVAIINKWIFDGNYVNALPLSQESLDECIDNKFIGIKAGVQYRKRILSDKNQQKNNKLNQTFKIFDNTTIFTSLIVFLKFLNLTEKAEHVNTYFHQIKDKPIINKICSKGFGTFVNVMQTLKTGNIFINFKTLKIKDPKKFNIFTLSVEEKVVLYHIIIYSNEKKICICLYNNQIYMSDEKEILELNLINLNKCLDGVYLGIECGYMHIFVINETMKNNKRSECTIYLDYIGDQVT
jgi:hypothetical protein